jgi:RHS repeat-associated protein
MRWDAVVILQQASYYRARYYDQAAGRFLSEDPIAFGGGGNFYRYGWNNVINGFDPLGLSFWSCFGRGFVHGVVLTTAVVATAAAIVAVAPAAAPIVTGTLFVTGVAGVASTAISMALNHSANNIGRNLGGLAGSALVGGAAGKALAGLLSPPGLQPPAETPLIESSWNNAWRNPETGNISILQFFRDFPTAVKTGPDTWGNRVALTGTGAGLALATPCDDCK